MRKLAIFSGAFALAAAGYVYNLIDKMALWAAAAAIIVSLLCRIWRLRAVSLACLGVAVSLLWCSFYQQIFLMDAFIMDGSEQTVLVKITETPSKTAYGAAVSCRLDRYEAILYGNETLLDASPGDSVSCLAQIELRADDMQSRSDGTVLHLYGQEDVYILKGKPNVPQRLRMWLQGRIDALFQGEPAGLIKALLTGDRSGLS